MSSMKSKFLLGALSAFAMLSLASAASAETPWERAHPRRDEVVDRLQNQNHRINEEYREGDISRREAFRLHEADYRILNQERRDAFFDHGHITRGEEWRLNHEENRVSHRIGN